MRSLIISVATMPNKSIQITWSQISGYDGMYKLYRREIDEIYNSVIYESSTNLSYIDTNIEPGCIYYIMYLLTMIMVQRIAPTLIVAQALKRPSLSILNL